MPHVVPAPPAPPLAEIHLEYVPTSELIALMIGILTNEPPGVYMRATQAEKRATSGVPGGRQSAKGVLKEVEPDWAKARVLFPATATELAERTGWPKRTTEYRLQRWRGQGRVVYERTSTGRAVPGTWRLGTDTRTEDTA